MKDFIGLNGHTVQFRPALYRPVAELVRDYHPVSWDLAEEPAKLPEFPIAKNRVDWSQVYASWTAKGWTIDASLMFESIPREKWHDLPAEARAYGEAFAHAFGPSAARPLVQSVEIGNEPGKWTDADFAVLCRGMSAGLRAGDPKLTIATCNLTTGKSTDYAKSVSCLDGLLGNFDVLTIHTYALLEGWPTWERSFPEDPRLKAYLPDIEKLCAWRDAHAPSKPVWITEFGYDSTTRKPDARTEFAKWKSASDTQQAQWLVRSLLVFSSLPVERAYVYFFDDKDEPSLHASSGITRDFVPKPAFHALAHMQRMLGNFRFTRIVENRPGALRIHEYRSAGGEIIWAAWSPTGSERRASMTLPPFPAPLVSIEEMPLNAAAPNPERIGPNRTLTVTESPKYLSFAPPRAGRGAN